MSSIVKHEQTSDNGNVAVIQIDKGSNAYRLIITDKYMHTFIDRRYLSISTAKQALKKYINT